MFELKLFIAIVGLITISKLIYSYLNNDFPFSYCNKRNQKLCENLNIIESKNLINPKINEALEKGSKERHDNLLKHLNSVQIEKEYLLKDDYIYDKIKKAVSKNEYYFVMCTDNDEIRRDAINLIPGMKAYIDKLGKLTVTFPNRE